MLNENIKKRLKNSLILGLGKTGQSLVNFFKRNNIENFFVWDDDIKKRSLFENILNIKDLKKNNISQVFVSPGVSVFYPEPHEIIKFAVENNYKITNDIELFYEIHKNKKLIGITGTNGKSSITKMICDIINASGYKARCLGNIGNPVFDEKNFDYDYYCIELSSFQLEACKISNLDIAILLDITPDHMDRYNNFEEYAYTKSNIFCNRETSAIISVDANINKEILKTLKNEVVIPISTKSILKNGFSINKNNIYKNDKIISEISLNNSFSENILASYTCAHLLNLNEEKTINAIKNYASLPHRLEIIKKHKKITIINDSKATNAESAARALQLYKNIYWLAGGKIKKDNNLNEISVENIKKAFFFGESKSILAKTFENKVKYEIFDNLFDACVKALEKAKKSNSDIILLLSPAHSSFDEFENFEERGNFFKQLVEKIL